ncbi:50S ribosomal protein L23 [Thermodesulfobacteriota bacterium]
MKDVYGVIRKPIVTEKSSLLKEEANKVVFEVDRRANKIEIKYAVQRLFNVSVLDVRVMNYNGKKKRLGRTIGRKSDWKKAVVTLKQGDNIEFFEGV